MATIPCTGSIFFLQLFLFRTLVILRLAPRVLAPHVTESHDGLRGICRRYHAIGSYWRYEWCHEEFVRQYSIDRVTGEENESISLGHFYSSTYDGMGISQQTEVPMTSASRTRAFLPQIFLNGDLCRSDKSSKHQVVRYRSTEVRVTCCVFQELETYIESIREPVRFSIILMRVTFSNNRHLADKVHSSENKSLARGEENRLQLKESVRVMFYHAYNSYMTYAFPSDNLKPISCEGDTFELGKIPMLTLIDTLDTLVVLGDKFEFRHAVRLVLDHANFDIDADVSVFETTIRVLGGLLSAHIFAVDKTLKLYELYSDEGTKDANTYSNGLLNLAVDLANRLLPAFATRTGIPYGTVNLRYGVPIGETTIASTAGAGSLTMEFMMLSVLTGNPVYASAARSAVRALFARRSSLGLVGKHLDVHTGYWEETISGPGSNSDSFYEYLLKMYVLYGDQESYDMFLQVYSSVMEHNKHGDWYTDVSMWNGCSTGSGIFENLAAFWPGMQTFLGDLHQSSRSLNAFHQVSLKFDFLPEQFDIFNWRPKKKSGNRYPLRPELIESVFYIHAATKDPSWLAAGAYAVQHLERYSKTTCGYASISDVETRAQEDYMPSFFLSETLKYLYLLFDSDNFLRKGNYVFTTEAHPFPVFPYQTVQAILKASGNNRNYSIPAASSNKANTCQKVHFWHSYSLDLQYKDEYVHRKKRCVYSNPRNSKWPISSEPSKRLLYGGEKYGDFSIEQLVDGFQAKRVETSEWLKVTSLGEPKVVIEYGPGQSQLSQLITYDFESKKTQRCLILIRENRQIRGSISCSAARFGKTQAVDDHSSSVLINEGTLKYATPETACKALSKDAEKKIVVAKRGECFFDAKAWYAMDAGAVALIVVNNDPQESLMIMARSSKEVVDNIKIPVVMVSLASEPILRNAVDNGSEVSLEYRALLEREEEYPRVEGTSYEMVVFGPNGWCIKLSLRFSEPTAESSWNIQIQDRETISLESTPESASEA